MLQEYFNTFPKNKYLSMIHVFVPPASYIEQLDSVPGKSGACRFSPEKPGFSSTLFRDFAMQLTWSEFLSYCLEMSHIIDRLSATPQLCTQLMYGSGLRVGGSIMTLFRA